MSKKDEEIFDLIKDGLEDAIEFFDGNKKKGRVATVEFIEVKTYDASRVKKIRKDHKLSQERLSALLGVSLDTVKKWETDVNHPQPGASRLLQMLEANPKAVFDTFEKRAE